MRALFGAAAVAMIAGSGIAVAGSNLPNVGDKKLGKAGGLSYRLDREIFETGDSGDNADAGCGPQRSKVLGGGVQGLGPVGGRHLYDTRPKDSDLDGGFEPDDGWSGGGSGGRGVVAYSICSKAGLGKLSYHESAEAPDDPAQRIAQINCPGGTHAASGGGVATSAHPDTQLVSSVPVDGADRNKQPDDGWLLRAVDPAGFVAANVVCRRGPGLVYRKAVRRGIGAGQAGAATAKCPKGSHVVGGGARVKGPISNGRVIDSHPVDLRSDRDRVPDDGWRAKSVNENGAGKRLTVHAICLR